MLQLQNRTGFAGTLFASPDPHGVDTLYAVIKATFTLTPSPEPAEEQVPIALETEFHDDPADSSIRVPSDIGLLKPGTDVLLMGHAQAPGGGPTPWLDVTLRVGPVGRIVRVFGDRFWRRARPGYEASAPVPFRLMPLVWERAWGGRTSDDPSAPAEPRNPVGIGFGAAEGGEPIEGSRLPNLEDPYAPITSPRQKPEPVCFAPVAPHWEPRRAFAGTYDQAWQANRAPFLPEDFDPRFLQSAPPYLVVPDYLKGGEPVELQGVRAEGPLSFRVPTLAIRVAYVIDGDTRVDMGRLDTLILEPDENRFMLVWRSAVRCDKQLSRVQVVRAETVRPGVRAA